MQGIFYGHHQGFNSTGLLTNLVTVRCTFVFQLPESIILEHLPHVAYISLNNPINHWCCLGQPTCY